MQATARLDTGVNACPAVVTATRDRTGEEEIEMFQQKASKNPTDKDPGVFPAGRKQRILFKDGCHPMKGEWKTREERVLLRE